MLNLYAMRVSLTGIAYSFADNYVRKKYILKKGFVSGIVESYEMEDWQVTHIKAQTAQNLGQYQKAEQAWRHLVKDFPQKPEFAYGLANTLILKDKHNYRKAIVVLKPFIQHDKSIHLGCLGLACEIYEISENYRAAFDLLDNCYKHIKDDPSLLIRHLDLGYRTGKEEKAEKSLVRLEILRQEGKIPEGIFMKVSFDQIVEELKNRHESIRKMNDKYGWGRLPRLMLCKQNNMPLYLDWALRTQEVQVLPSNPVELINYTTYCTNGLRVDRDKKGRNRLTPITAPMRQKNIVIDYHALITLHRLDLLNKLETYYEKIYYPSSLKILLLQEQRRFAPQQLARENTYKKLNERLDTNEIRVFFSPEPPEGDLEQRDSPLRRDLRLAQLRKFSYLSNYAEEKELTDFSDIKVFRLPQVIAWLYSGGNLAWSKYRDLLKLAVGRPELVKEKVNNFLDNAAQLLIDETTLAFMEQYDLIHPILHRGTQIVIEKNTADSLRYAVLGTDLKEKVKKWHQELADFLEGSEVFEESRRYSHFKEHNLSQDTYIETCLSSLSLAEETDNFLLTDDRWTQMVHIKEFKNKQFGTDALLAALHKEEKITVEDYARCFLQLLQWRYRFLLPDVDVLVYLAKEYKERPLGIHLSTIADYGQKCMEDIGLFLGPEQTEPQLPLGIKYHMEWITRWIDFLVRIWQDNNFTNENRRRITQKVYMQALPGAPKGLREELRSNYATTTNLNILMHLFHQTMKAETEPVQLYGLFKITFDCLGYDEQRRIAVLKSHLEFIKENLRKETDKDILFVFIVRAIEAFYGGKWPEMDMSIFDLSLIPILKELSLIVEKELTSVQMGKIKSKEARKYTEDELADKLENKENPEYVRAGPLLIVPPTKERLGEIFVPHERIQNHSAKLRQGGVKYLLELEDAYISALTREIIIQKKSDIVSGATNIWLPAAQETSEALLKDFFYTRSLFIHAFELPVRRNELVNIAWEHVLTANIDTILSERPQLICEQVTAESIRTKLEKDFWQKKKRDRLDQNAASVNIPKNNIVQVPEVTLKEELDWYLENVYFIPVASPLSPWQIIIEPMKKREQLIAKDGLNNDIIFQITNEWINEQEDPLAYLIALEIILNLRCQERIARGIAADEKLEILDKENFNKLLKRIFNVLFIIEKFDDTEKTQKTQDLPIRKFQVIWRMRRGLARYFLKYIDLTDKGKLKDEKRVVLAWWLARQVESSVLKVSRLFGNLQKRIAWLEKSVELIKEKERIINITHIFEDRKDYSNPRYFTLQAKALLPSAALSILMPPEDHDPNVCLPFNGLKFPTPALPTQVPEKMIYNMQISLIWGEGQIPSDSKTEIPWLWSKSLCVSVPAFLDGYYEEALKYFGKEKVGLISLAKEVSKPDFLNGRLLKIPQLVTNKSSRAVAIILSTFNVFLFTHIEIPKGAQVFEKNTLLAKALSQLDDDAADISLIALVGILMRLRTTGNNKWAEIIGKQFYSIDYVKCSQTIVDSVIPELSVAVLLGADYSIFQPIIKKKGADMRIRTVLGRIKEQIEQVFPRIPGAYKENARRILNDLDDIPIFAEKEEASKE